MNSGVSWVAAFLSLCFVSSEAMGDRDRGRPPDECGDPRQISQSHKAYRGTVIEVVDGDTLVVDIHGWGIESEYITYPSPRIGETPVQLVCVDAPPMTEPIGAESKEKLSARLLGKEVAVWESHYQEEGKPLNVMIVLQGGHPVDENVEQLEQGLARYRDFGPYALDFWTECHYERAQERAQNEKIGIWGELKE